jgi:type I restriction enzyme R subunit
VRQPLVPARKLVFFPIAGAAPASGTGAVRLDKRLRNLPQPWTIMPWRESLDMAKLTGHAVEEFPTASGPADYALFVDGKLLGIIEAKKVSLGPQNVLEQARRYSQGVSQGVGNW